MSARHRFIPSRFSQMNGEFYGSIESEAEALQFKGSGTVTMDPPKQQGLSTDQTMNLITQGFTLLTTAISSGGAAASGQPQSASSSKSSASISAISGFTGKKKKKTGGGGGLPIPGLEINPWMIGGILLAIVGAFFAFSGPSRSYAAPQMIAAAPATRANPKKKKKTASQRRYSTNRRRRGAR